MSQVHKNYIANEWVAGETVIENINPSDTSKIVGEYAQASDADISSALQAAQEGADSWGKSQLEQRKTALAAIGSELIARSGELGELLSSEEGKPLAEGTGEVYRAGQFFEYYAGEVLRQIGDTADSVRPDIEVDVRREPVGVVGVISPWNFPTATASWKIAPALAFGNSVIWKPANETPASAVALAEIIAKQNLPVGTFNLVMGSGSGTGQKLVESPLINAISFTGSYDVGHHIAASSIKNLTKIQLEMGSKNALVIMDDADLDLAVAHALGGAYGGTGQKCTASSRLIVHSKIHDQFVAKMVEGIKNLKVGHALEKGTQLGPVANEKQLHSNLDYVALAKEEGCEHVIGGEQLTMATDGYYMAPALFTGSTNDMRVNREEMFAPIACVIKVDSYEEALALANDTEYGLTAGIITSSLARATHFRRNVRTGCVMVNLPTAGTDYHVPFGGRKNSSFGSREQGAYAAEFYTHVKTAYIYSGAPV